MTPGQVEAWIGDHIKPKRGHRIVFRQGQAPDADEMQPTHIIDRNPHSDQAFAYFEFPYSFVLEEPEAYVEKWMWFLVGCSAQWSRARGGRLR